MEVPVDEWRHPPEPNLRLAIAQKDCYKKIDSSYPPGECFALKGN